MTHTGQSAGQQSGQEGISGGEEQLSSPAAAKKEEASRFILLVRHGVAEARAEGVPDETRKLTKIGVARMKEIARGLAQVFPKAELICASPLVRAAQTGAHLAKGYRGKVEVRSLDALAPGQDATAFLEALEAMPERHILFVGHEPGLTQLLGELCGLDTGKMGLKKGGCYGLRILVSGRAQLEWMMPPRVLRRIKA